MKDLDFDELDRAVNSLMANVAKTAPRASDDEKEKTLSIDSTLDGDTPPPFDKVEEVAAKATEEVASAPTPDPVATPSPKHDAVSAKPAAPAAHAAAVHARPQPAVTPAGRRGGRFMDVVHPSADMKKPDAPKPVSRQGATIEPLNASAQKIADIVPPKKSTVPEEKTVEPSVADTETVPKEDVAETPVISSASETPKMPAMPEPEKTDEPTSESDWPDPLDLAKPSEVEMPEPKQQEAEDPVPFAEPEPSVEEPAPTPLTTPFLPDAKVEKRPLGGLSGTEDTTAVEEPSRAPVLLDDTKKTVDDPNAQLPADPNAVEPQLPEELSGDLMAVEADTTHDEIKQAHESKLGSVALDQHETPVVSEPDAKPASAKEPAAPAGPTSIPQQYREEPSTGDKDNGAIYDTDTYHQPLSHPAKKKPEWMWVIWIVAILLLGAGGGAALYFLGLV